MAHRYPQGREGTYFGEFLWRDKDGRVHFVDQQTPGKRFIERAPCVWGLRKFRTFWSRQWERNHRSWYGARMNRSIMANAILAERRRWIPQNPIWVSIWRVEDARTARWKQ